MPPVWSVLRRHPFLRVWVIGGCGLAVATAIGLLVVAGVRPQAGLEATLLDGVGPDARTVWVGHDATLDPEAVASANGIPPDRPFAVQWQGDLVATVPGAHHLRARVDDGIGIWVKDRLVIDRLDHRGEIQQSAPIELEPGLHPIRIRYEQIGGDAVLRLWCASPVWREEFGLLRTRVVPHGTTFTSVLLAAQIPLLLATAWSVWILLGVLLGSAAMLASAGGIDRISSALGWPEVVTLAIVALPLLAANLWIGTAPWRGWVGDEIIPSQVLDAWEMRFAGGWFDMYPALPFYLFMIVNSPSVLLMGTGPVEFGAALQTLTHLMSRGLSLGFAWLTLLAVALLADRTIGGRARLLAPYVVLGVPLFAFYSKTYNPESAYTFWVTAGAVAFVRAASTGSIAAHAWLGVFAAASVATKDQAYGCWIGPALVLLWSAWRKADGGALARLRATALHRGLWAGLSATVLTYSVVSGAWWNLDGLRAHFAIITGRGSTPFRMFSPTLSGFNQLAATAVALFGQTIGPVAVVLTLIGLAVLAVSGTGRRFWIVLSIPVGYCLTFVGVVGYVYDRYLIVVVVMLALAAGAGWAWIVERMPKGRTLSVVAYAAVLLVVLAPTLVLNVRIAGDSRRDAERWMRETLTGDPLVLGTGSSLYLPNLYPFLHEIEPRASTDNLLSWNADVIVVYEDWFGRRSQPRVDRVRQVLDAAGYRERFASRRDPPNAWMALLFSALNIDSSLSSLAKIDPPLAIWVRERRAVAAGDNRRDE
ncbi:MAG TPA: PA14 domain-containing protein [Vicinamibacterales bacterium]|nr:PA14 domain-containing protein [Vicinamibacterales bacterium]